MSEEKKDNGKVFILVLCAFLIATAILFTVNSIKMVYISNDDLDVNIQDQTSEIIDLKLVQTISNITLDRNYTIGERYINFSADSAPIVGYVICLKDRDSSSFMQADILEVVSLGGNNYQVYLDMPLDHPFSIDDGCSFGNSNWAVDGSINPQIFSLSPEFLSNDTSWDITRMLMECSGAGMSTPGDEVPDLTAFFVMDPIDNGIFFRSVDGTTKNIFNAKNNGDLALRMYDITINTELNKNGLYTSFARRSFAGPDKNGVTVRLDSVTGDTYEQWIQDNLTFMTRCQTVLQGHVVEN